LKKADKQKDEQNRNGSANTYISFWQFRCQSTKKYCFLFEVGVNPKMLVYFCETYGPRIITIQLIFYSFLLVVPLFLPTSHQVRMAIIIGASFLLKMMT
jgi:hypothetical protein